MPPKPRELTVENTSPHDPTPPSEPSPLARVPESLKDFHTDSWSLWNLGGEGQVQIPFLSGSRCTNGGLFRRSRNKTQDPPGLKGVNCSLHIWPANKKNRWVQRHHGQGRWGQAEKGAGQSLGAGVGPGRASGAGSRRGHVFHKEEGPGLGEGVFCGCRWPRRAPPCALSLGRVLGFHPHVSTSPEVSLFSKIRILNQIQGS